jgi:hypothetical protein
MAEHLENCIERREHQFRRVFLTVLVAEKQADRVKDLKKEMIAICVIKLERAHGGCLGTWSRRRA